MYYAHDWVYRPPFEPRFHQKYVTTYSANQLFQQALDGVLSFAGAIAKMTSKTGLAGTLSFGGELLKTTSKFPEGVLSFGGALGAVFVAVKAVAGTLTFNGALLAVLVAQKVLAGVLSFVGALSTVFIPAPVGAAARIFRRIIRGLRR